MSRLEQRTIYYDEEGLISVGVRPGRFAYSACYLFDENGPVESINSKNPVNYTNTFLERAISQIKAGLEDTKG